MAPTIKIYNDSEELVRQYHAVNYIFGYPRKGTRHGGGVCASIPKSCPAQGQKASGWQMAKTSIMDGPGDPAPDNEGLVITDEMLSVDGQTRIIPTIGPVTLNLSGGIPFPEDWVPRTPPLRAPWV